MKKVRYMISDAANMMQVESHVLRYWEEELELDVPRNEMGHRYYTEENMQKPIRNVKRLSTLRTVRILSYSRQKRHLASLKARLMTLKKPTSKANLTNLKTL